MSAFEAAEFRDHEVIHFACDSATGLRAIFAIHSTVRGPALGGVRMFPYRDSQYALRDVLRLSEAMSLKSAFAGLSLGGGKSVILGDPHRDKSPALWRAFGRALQGLAGRYWCAEDVGTSPDDMEQIHAESAYVAGLPDGSGNPGPVTALGVREAMRAAVQFRLDRAELADLRIAIQGCGNVGRPLARLLHEAGARLVVSDVDPKAARAVASECGAECVAPEQIAAVAADVFAPCALGGVLNPESVKRLRAAVICGAANNQLEFDSLAERLQEQDVLYVPDFAANAGGVISVARELAEGGCADWRAGVAAIFGRCEALFARARAEGITPLAAAQRAVADALAEGDADRRPS